jgi:DNA processing protein
MRDWIALNMTPGIGPRSATKLLERFGSAEAVFGSTRGELERLRLRPETVESIIGRSCYPEAEKELGRVREMGGDILILDDGNYPALLREIADPPITLYVQGAWELCLNQPCVAVVGSRQCSTYGRNAAIMLSRDLASRGITIVSGLARGIDAAAHEGALEAGGRTVAVMGTGIGEVYPKEHKRLADQILEKGGALVSEFPIGTPPTPHNFPYRNRVISGLSLGILVVEASEHSGSLITARLALEQGREVFAVPGNITSKKSFGTNYLIKGAGAKLVQAWQDVVQELPHEIASKLLPTEEVEVKEESSQNNLHQDQQQQLPMTSNTLTGNLYLVFKLLSPDEPSHIDQLSISSKLNLSELNEVLLELEMRNLITQLPGKCFVKRL